MDDPPTDTTCRIAHMSVEYVLKAYLMLNKSRIPKSHDLVMILDECAAIHNDTDFETLRTDCQLLSTYRIDLVYPGPLPIDVSVDEAKAAINMAQQIYNFVINKAVELGYSQL